MARVDLGEAEVAVNGGGGSPTPLILTALVREG